MGNIFKRQKKQKYCWFSKNVIIIDVQNKKPKEVIKKAKKLLTNTITWDTKDAYNNDELNKRIKKITKKFQHIKTKEPKQEPILSNIIDVKNIKTLLKKAKKTIKKDKKSTYYEIVIPMPNVHKNGKKISKYLLKKAKEVKPYVDKYSQKEQIPIEFIFAIIHSESSFNPLSRSYVPAFGLMQIVPTTAGADAMQYISGKKLF